MQIKDKETYYSLYSKKLVDNATSYFESDYAFNAKRMGLMLQLEEHASKNKTIEERGEEFLKLLEPTMMFTYLHGASENAGITFEETQPNHEDHYSDFRKSRDFCIFFNFGDNDFGEHVREGIEPYVDKYNRCLDMIDSYIADGIDVSNSSYVKDIELLENIEKIKKCISYGVIAASVNSYNDYSLIFPEREMMNPMDVMQDAYGKIEYLGIEHDENYKVGTYSEVENWVINKYKRQDDDTLKTIWMNGEALIVAVIDGEMKYWIK